MRPDNADDRGTEQIRTRGSGPAEPLATQVIAAVGYTVLIVSLALPVFASFTDDFGLGQAAIACLPVGAASLAAIKRKGRP